MTPATAAPATAAPATATAATTPATVVVTEHKPGLKLTREERMTNFDKHQYGLCVSCDAGLDDRADFTCDPRFPQGFALMCHACFNYYNKNGYTSCGYGPFSNAAFQ